MFPLEKLKTLENNLVLRRGGTPHPPSQRETFSLHFWTFQSISLLKKEKTKVWKIIRSDPSPRQSVENSALFCNPSLILLRMYNETIQILWTEGKVEGSTYLISIA